MYKQGNMEFVFELEVDWHDVEQVAEDVFVLREDLYFSEYELLWDGAFEDYYEEDYEDDDYYDESQDSDDSEWDPYW